MSDVAIIAIQFTLQLAVLGAFVWHIRHADDEDFQTINLWYLATLAGILAIGGLSLWMQAVL